MSVLTQNSNVLKSLQGDVYSESVGNSHCVLHIDTDLQIPNRIHKSATDNKVRQITDKVQGIIFSQTDAAKQPVYNYGGYLSFDGGDVIYSTKNVNLGSAATFDFWCKLDNTTGLKMVASGDTDSTTKWELYFNDKNLNFYSASTDVVGCDLTAYDLTTGFFHISAILDGSFFYVFYNGSFISDIVAPYTFDNTGLLQFGGLVRTGTAYFSGSIKSMRIYDNVQHGIGTQYNFTPEQPFQHYQRYPEDAFKKLFISSKYLKDAVIDSADKIQKLSSNFTNLGDTGTPFIPYMYQATLGNRPTLTKNGIKFVAANSEALMSTNDEPNGLPYYWYASYPHDGTISDYCFMFWHMPLSSASNQCVFDFTGHGNLTDAMAVWYNHSSGVNKYLVVVVGNYIYSDVISLNKYNHICTIRKGSLVYLFINGILTGTLTYATAFAIWGRINLGAYRGNNYYADCLIDDVLAAHNDYLIDPTGYAVGDKVFEPPTRGGFDNTFTIYPIP